MVEKIKDSRELYHRASQVMPGGVNSPVRAFKSIGLPPPVISHGKGPYLYSVEGKRYIDYIMSWGPLILGHAHSEVMEFVSTYLQKGTSFGALCEIEIMMAEKVTSLVPSVEVVRFVNSGTEATMSAIRLARAFTGRNLIVKFDGCYHGHADSFLIKAGSGLATFQEGTASSPGVPEQISGLSISLPYNDLETVEQVFHSRGEEIACVIVEPVAANMGVILPEDNFLPGLRKLTQEYGSLLIFDEVITGFRLGPDGAQGRFKITPDLTTFGKVIGGGFPVGAYGGKREIMSLVAPDGPVYQAGTLSGNPIAMAAGYKTLDILLRDNHYEFLEQIGKKFQQSLSSLITETGLPLHLQGLGSIFTLFYRPQEVKNFQDASNQDLKLFQKVFKGLLNSGILIAPSTYEALFLSIYHDQQIIDETIEKFREVFKSI